MKWMALSPVVVVKSFKGLRQSERVEERRKDIFGRLVVDDSQRMYKVLVLTHTNYDLHTYTHTHTLQLLRLHAIWTSLLTSSSSSSSEHAVLTKRARIACTIYTWTSHSFVMLANSFLSCPSIIFCEQCDGYTHYFSGFPKWDMWLYLYRFFLEKNNIDL